MNGLVKMLAVAGYFHSSGVSVSYPGLSNHPQFSLAKDTFNGFGPLLTIDLGTKDRAFSFISKLKNRAKYVKSW